MIDPFKSYETALQTIGRGVRKADDKDIVYIFDISSDLKYSTKHRNIRLETYKEAKIPYTVDKIEYEKLEERVWHFLLVLIKYSLIYFIS